MRPPRNDNKSRAPQKRGAVKKSAATFIGVYVPEQLDALIHSAAVKNDSDKSKWMRKAIRRQLQTERMLTIPA